MSPEPRPFKVRIYTVGAVESPQSYTEEITAISPFMAREEMARRVKADLSAWNNWSYVVEGAER